MYLETGVQSGLSLQLSNAAFSAGIDPSPLLTSHRHHRIYSMTSDEFFDAESGWSDDLPGPIDLAFIDGMHLFEYALRDFHNIETHSHPETVVVFDDVLPRNQGEAARVQCAGDWTGDVWKVWLYLRRHRPDLRLIICDTEPTGTLIVTGLGREGEAPRQVDVLGFSENARVPHYVLNRDHAWSPTSVLNELARWRTK